MAKRIVIIQGHPDPREGHFGQAMADAYARGAQAGGHDLRRIRVAQLDFPLLRDAEEFEKGEPPPSIREAQEAIRWAEHLFIIYPLWLGTMPALLKGFFEQVFRPGFALDMQPGHMPKKLLKGKSARIVITMGMPALLYRWYFGAHGLKNLERNILGFAGVAPIHASLMGVGEGNPARREKWLTKMGSLGRDGR